ncbi:hypothetical protein ANO11243_013390 [Dothideomycetidae sp. 11243]|nr:hypothetical protein ANO11243_013390 [fungal sp. No.11243]
MFRRPLAVWALLFSPDPIVRKIQFSEPHDVFDEAFLSAPPVRFESAARAADPSLCSNPGLTVVVVLLLLLLPLPLPAGAVAVAVAAAVASAWRPISRTWHRTTCSLGA